MLIHVSVFLTRSATVWMRADRTVTGSLAALPSRTIKSWAMRLAKRNGMKKAKVALSKSFKEDNEAGELEVSRPGNFTAGLIASE
jgi:hypothetical protein